MSTGLGEIHVDSIDGVPLLWIDGPPPFTMFLIFRVGQADEHLQNAGITHMIEHLAFPHDHGDSVGNNGTTELTRTRFFAWGDPAEAAEFLHRISRSLARPPVDRIDQQRDIIFTEESRWAVTAYGELLIARYGALRHGVAGFRQLGLRRISEEDVRTWAARYFTRGNAILCMTGPPPARLALELPDGPARPAPTGVPEDAPYPRWTVKPQPHVAMSVATGHGAASGTATRLLERRLYDRLRHQKAVSYSVQSDGQLIDSETLHRMIVADCLQDAAPLVTDEMIAAAYDLAESGPTTAELGEELNRLERQLRDDPRAIAGWMLYAADCYLNGIDVDEFEDYLAKRRDLTRADVRDAWREAVASLILCVPPWVVVNDPRFTMTTWPPQVTGRTFHPPGLGRFRGGLRAVLGDDGLSLIGEKGDHATVLFDRVAAMLRVLPAERILVANDGSELGVDASTFAGGEDLLAALDRAVASDRWITFGS